VVGGVGAGGSAVGVVARRQLLALGASSAVLDAWVRRRRLHRVHQGVYALGHTALRVEGRRLAAVLACGPGAVLSHISAATHWGLLRSDQTRIDVTAARGRHGARGSACTALVASMPKTPPTTKASRSPRSAAPCSISPPPRAPQSSSARWRRPSAYSSNDHRAIESTIARANGHRGSPVLARATSRTPKWTRNEWEAEFLALIRKARLPEPQTNDAFDVPDHGHCEPDYHWPEHRVIVEIDGFETHGTRAAFRHDRAKDAALTASGYRVLRFTRDDDPALAIKRLSALLASSSSAQGLAR
jgi:very-short-patch-repair endonuclease